MLLHFSKPDRFLISPAQFLAIDAESLPGQAVQPFALKLVHDIAQRSFALRPFYALIALGRVGHHAIVVDAGKAVNEFEILIAQD